MSDIGESLRTFLLADADILAAVGKRVHEDHVPQLDANPEAFLLLWKVATNRVLLLNNDAVLEGGALRRLAEALDDPALAAVGATVITPAGAVESRGQRFDARWGRQRLIDHGRTDEHGEGLRPVAAVAGPAWMIRTDALDAVGELDEAFFWSFEETDWSLRARARGLGVAIVLGARVRHAGSATLGTASPDRLYYAARNHLRLAARVGAPRTAVAALNLAHALRQHAVPRLAAVRAVLAGLRDAAHGKGGPRAEAPA